MRPADDPDELRRAAEAQIEAKPTAARPAVEAEDMPRLLHELQVHQIELQMQNEELRAARAEAEAALMRYVVLYDFAPVGYFSFDAQGVIRQLNLAAARLLGLDRVLLIGRRFGDFLALPSRPAFAALLAAAATGERPQRAEMELIPRSNGDPASRHIHVEATKGDGDHACRAAVTDISVRKAAEEALQARESTLRSILWTTPDLVYSVDRQGRILYFNRAPAGEGAENLMGNDFADLLDPVSRPLARERIQQVFAAGALQRFEVLAEAFTDRPTWFEVIAGPVRRDDRIVSATLLARDVSERRATAEELDRHRHHLEEMVTQRTAVIEELNRQLERRAVESEAASRAKSTFLANMSHEIRTPMNAIMGLTEILRRQGGLNDHQDQTLAKIAGAASHLLSILNNVLDLSKIEAGKISLEAAEFSVAAMMNNLTVLITPKLREKRLRFAIDTDHLPPTLLGDETRLTQALLNFLGNAVKFTERGQITLHAEVIEETEDDLLLRFSVEDTGIGITEELRGRLFGAFEQADASTTRRFGGTGLGLAINRHLATLMGGSVGAEPRRGGGSVFWVMARFAKPRRDAFPARADGRDETAEQALSRLHRGARVLLAEDDEINREVAGELLKDVGLSVDFAVDGGQALEMARRGDYALILMDLQMPVLDGLAAAREIRRLPHCATTPIVAMTANAFDEDRAACLQAGMDDHLGKPVIPEIMYARLLRWLSTDRAATGR